MPNNDKSKTSILHRIVDIGANKEFSITENRYLRITNIASILGILFMVMWMITAFCITDSPILYGSNGLLALMFSFVLIFNSKGWRVLASTWFTTTSYIGIILFLYLLGYSSGVWVICFIIIITPYMTFPKSARKLAIGFSMLGVLTLIISVTFQSKFYPHYDVLDPYFLQMFNISTTGLICITIAWTLSVLIDKSEDSLRVEQKRSDDLLHNILPVNVARDLKETGKTVPKRHKNVTILFTDFKGFTELVASIPAITLVNELNDIFGRFDEIVEELGVEKIETIGDAYMAACGLEKEIKDHAINCIKAAQQMLSYLEERNMKHEIKWRMRVGIHTGPIVAGVVGKKKFNYDLFGDTVNTASRIESLGEPSKINISETTYQLVKNDITCERRGKIQAKGKGELEMYFIKYS
ncbi:adenylate/guanylate cyclase domain-containing protein [Seonamhaeicola maritimus]|uniref:Adenylate/guanylate cyclase domain-containing protein n=1 Tax=Seonamhaeicola maritimus TaxID=2591822 RepID=A0A5C7GFK5_9FLAO|nr:adenylate/guanylate cyclase domain-containing protein [Seonamhaeicola maritimus]TXG35774.1 adenylate/guanylate cyclase domain-containing protein [Seonamhaeicola maritimus]